MIGRAVRAILGWVLVVTFAGIVGSAVPFLLLVTGVVRPSRGLLDSFFLFCGVASGIALGAWAGVHAVRVLYEFQERGGRE